MTKQYASLAHIDHDHKIAKETDDDFLHHLQSGLLLALKEQGRLNDIQYRRAQERLDRQNWEWAKKEAHK